MAHTKKSIAGNVNNGSVNTFSYSGSFDVFKASEVEVELDNVALTFTTSTINESASPREYTVDFTNKTVHIGGADLASTDQVVIQPVTDMGSPTPRATYTAGASVTSADLNNNQLQLLRKAMEYDEQKLSSRGGTMTGNLHMGEDVNLSFEGATDNNFETTITVADPTSDKTITFPDTTGTVVTTGDTGTVATGMIAADAITGAKIADDQINSEHYVDGSIDTAHIGSAQVNADKLASDSVITAKIQNLAVTTDKIADDAVTMAKLGSGSLPTDITVASANIVDGTIATADIGADQITNALIADNQIDSEHYVDGSVDRVHLAADLIDGTKIADDSINSEHYVDGSIDTAHIADAQVTQPKLSANAVATANIADNQVSTAKLIDSSVTTAKINADAVTNAKIADDSIDSEHYVDGSIDTAHIAGAQVTDAKLASNSVVTSKITDANVTTVKIADSNVTLGKLASDLKQTTISDSDTQLPTSGAVVDYVAAQLLPFGGFEAVATEVAFPNTQPASGVIISISDAAGVVVSGSGVSTTGRTVGGSTVTINNFPSSLNGETLASGVGLMVSSTGSSQTYNYHKILAAETDVKQLSDDINDFNARYRVGSSNPTSALDGGDLFFNTGTSKLLVYNNTSSAWEEAQSIGNFFISTFSEAFDGSRTQFTLSNAPTNVQQIILSLNGVIQKPGTAFTLSGSTVTLASAPASGTDYFAVVMGSTVNIGTPSDGTVDTDVLTSGAVTTVKIADGAVNSAKIADGAIVNADVNASAAIAGTKISPDFGSQNVFTTGNLVVGGASAQASDAVTLMSDGEVTAAGMYFSNNIGTAMNTEGIRRKTTNTIAFDTNSTERMTLNNSGLDVTGNITVSGTVDGVDVAALNTTVSNLSTDIVSDTSPQLGGDLDTNSHHILIDDDHEVKWGNNSDVRVFHANGNANFIQSYNVPLRISQFGTSQLKLQTNESQNSVVCNANGATELGYSGSIKLATLSYGINVTGAITASNNINFGNNTAKFMSGSSNQLQMYYDGSNAYINNTVASQLKFATNNTVRCQVQSDGHFAPVANNTYDLGTSSMRWRNVYTNDLHLSNKGHTNDVDQTWGDWTIQEGESDLFLKNNRSGKKYKFNLTEVS